MEDDNSKLEIKLKEMKSQIYEESEKIWREIEKDLVSKVIVIYKKYITVNLINPIFCYFANNFFLLSLIYDINKAYINNKSHKE